MGQFRTYAVIFVVSIGIFLANLDASIVNIALPSFARLFQVGTNRVSGVMLAYLVAYSSLLLLFGRLADLKGAKRVFVYGFAWFGLASLLCGLAQGLIELQIFRAAQGIGAAMILASWGALVVQNVPAAMHGRAIGLITVVGAMAYAVGPPIGGLILNHLSWPWIFYINLPMCLLAIPFSIHYLADRPADPRPAGSLDIGGAVLSLSALALFVVLMNQGREVGWTSPWILAAMGGTLLCGGGFFVLERRRTSPLLEMTLFQNHDLVLGLCANLISVIIMDGAVFLLPFYFELIHKLEPSRIGLILMVFPLASIFVSPLAGYLSDRIGARKVSIGGAAILVPGSIMLCFFDSTLNLGVFLFSAFIVLGISFSVFYTSNTALVVGHAPANKEGITTAILSFTTAIGSVLGVSLYETAFALRLPAGTRGLFEFPPAVLDAGFFNAFLTGLVLSVGLVVIVGFAKQRARPALEKAETGRAPT